MRWYGTRNVGNEERCLRKINGKLVWDFEFNLHKTTMARRPDLILEDKEKKKIWICDMACPQQRNIETKRIEKLTKHRQLAFEMRERRPDYVVTAVPLIIVALGDGMCQVAKDVGMIFENNDVTKKTICEMQKTVLMDSETTARKVLSGLIQQINE